MSRPDPQNMPHRGVLYIAWGSAHVAVARRSAASVKRRNPGLATALCCRPGDDTRGFDLAFEIPDGVKRPKLELLHRTPFAETLYLDNDTLVRADLTGLFDLLGKYEMGGAHVTLWHRPRHNKPIRRSLPDAFPEINCGVLLYRRSPRVLAFLARWAERYHESGMSIDQPSFREVLWESDIAFCTLPEQYNKRVFEASELIWSDQPKPRILHLELLQPQKNRLMRWLSDRVR
ncbi:hypothetical protein [Roseivivax sp. CAU 1761]